MMSQRKKPLQGGLDQDKARLSAGLVQSLPKANDVQVVAAPPEAVEDYVKSTLTSRHKPAKLIVPPSQD